MKRSYSIGIDIGTGSVRACLVDVENGRIVSSEVHEISVWEPRAGYFEQSSAEIYAALCSCVRAVTSDVDKSSIIGLGIDATCSLVVVTSSDEPISISPTKEPDRNIILWADHRAIPQASRINSMASDHEGVAEVLRYVGGTISPEMETPKLLWIKENLPEVFEREDIRYFDLADYFTWKMSGNEVRSTCTTVCKWTYLAEKSSGWSEAYFREIGLFDQLGRNDFEKIGASVKPMGQLAGRLKSDVAVQLGGLSEETAVGVGMIDAHAAGIGAVGADTSGFGIELAPEERLALIAGTSCCHMAVSVESLFVPGVWGPYKDAMIPGYSLAEGGQSAVGKAIDHVMKSHPAFAELEKRAAESGQSMYDILDQVLTDLTCEREYSNGAFLTTDVHVLPYFHGNRSPRADSSLKGVISGLTISNTIEDLAVTYLATIQSLAYDTKHIIDQMNSHGHSIRGVFICGGLKKNPLYVRSHVDVLQLPVFVSAEEHSACVGASILGAVAAGHYESIVSGMKKMNNVSEEHDPSQDEELISFHKRKYSVFLKMYDHQMELRSLMES